MTNQVYVLRLEFKDESSIRPADLSALTAHVEEAIVRALAWAGTAEPEIRLLGAPLTGCLKFPFSIKINWKKKTIEVQGDSSVLFGFVLILMSGSSSELPPEFDQAELRASAYFEQSRLAATAESAGVTTVEVLTPDGVSYRLHPRARVVTSVASATKVGAPLSGLVDVTMSEDRLTRVLLDGEEGFAIAVETKDGLTYLAVMTKHVIDKLHYPIRSGEVTSATLRVSPMDPNDVDWFGDVDRYRSVSGVVRVEAVLGEKG